MTGLPVRWKKIWGDVRSMQGRMVLMVLALTLGLFGVTTILTSYTILMREVSVNYLSTRPASAQLEMDQVDAALVRAVSGQPGVRFAEASSTFTARLQGTDGRWFPVLLFVVPDFKHLTLNRFTSEAGQWPPAKGSMLLEREALKFLEARTGDTFTLDTAEAGKQVLQVSGTVHDPGLAPAWQEQTVYGYITPETLKTLGGSAGLHLLKVEVQDIQQTGEIVSKLSLWLKAQGHTVHEVRLPPALKHPHQGQMNAVLVMFLIFSGLAFLLSGILTATLIAGLLSQQVRQIGIMKSIGGRTSQIALLYLSLVAGLGLLSVVIGVPLGLLAGQGFAEVVASLLNLNLNSKAVPVWMLLLEVGLGVLLPMVLALQPILAATGTTVLKALGDHGVKPDARSPVWLESLLKPFSKLDRTLLLAIRNAFRKQGRMVLTLTLLAAAGGMFLTSLNVKAAWEKNLADAAQDRKHDLELRLNHFESERRVMDLLRDLPGVKRVEPWSTLPAAVARKDGLSVVRTYPDGGHGSFSVRSVPVDTRMAHLTVLEGRWLKAGDAGVVLNHNARAFFPGVQVGETVKLSVEGKPMPLKLLGVVREIVSPAAAYVLPETFSGMMQTSTRANAFRVQLEPGASPRVQTEIETVLQKAGIQVKVGISEEMLDDAVSGHVYILIVALLLMSLVMAVVGVLGLTASMGANVVERTREFGIMRAVGGTSRTIVRNVTSEGLFLAGLSFVLAVLVSLPLSYGVGTLIGMMSFRFPLPLTVSLWAVVSWLLLVALGAWVASVVPAWSAARLTVRETLSYQ